MKLTEKRKQFCGYRKSFPGPVGQGKNLMVITFQILVKDSDVFLDRALKHFHPAIIVCSDFFFEFREFADLYLGRFPERTSPVLLQIPFVCTNCPQKFSGLDLIFKYFPVQMNRVPIDQNSPQIKYQIFHHSYRSITIGVNRLSHTWRFLSSLSSILHTWTVRPIRMGVTRPVTRPSFADRR